ncbi:L-type lectin-domain containing receptor kinase V.9-like [Cryptomeria japonica]|uniref:L-type lectin-domain containing receptor kinase V.9-like n=1 Tax=Cryptomeria japonica TaxID=3369 RepID=UPI0027D9F65E|nr:L-type lectin-domain containing receptor kinase V.9-like [Cryptomeria japonica]
MSVCSLLILVLHVFLTAQAHTSFVFSKFNASTLYQVEYSSIRSGAICLSNQSQRVSGRVLYPQPVRMKDSTSTNTSSSFSTTFVFAMLPYSSDPSLSGQGMAFIITPSKSPVENSSNQYLGLLNNSNIGKPDNHLFPIEFDTVQSGGVEDIKANHVGVDLNDLKSEKCEGAGYWIGNQFHELYLNSGQNIQAWIDYDHTQQQLNVTIVEAGSPRPQKPLISLKNMTLSNIFEEQMYVGFSASTGAVVEDHCLLAWSFSTNGSAPELDVSHLPSLLKRKKSNSRLIAAITTTLVLLVLLLVAAAVFRWKRNKYRDVKEEWEMEYWPHRFDYKELHIATKGFRDDKILGFGGFGQVYKGVLPSNGHEVAVISIFRKTTESLKDFIAEISVNYG